jgi:hypothetical protein
MTLDPIAPLKGRDLEEYGAARIRNEAFEQVRLLWERRKKEGWTQKMIAEQIGRDPGWVSRTLSAPGNWTLRTIGAFTQALKGEVEIKIVSLEDSVETASNFDAYEGYIPDDVLTDRGNNIAVSIDMSQPSYPFDVPLGLKAA